MEWKGGEPREEEQRKPLAKCNCTEQISWFNSKKKRGVEYRIGSDM